MNRNVYVLPVTAILALAFLLPDPQVHAQEARNRQALLSDAEITSLATEPNPKFDPTRLSKTLAAKEPAERKAILKKLIASRSEYVAWDATEDAIRGNDTELASVIASQIANWSAPPQASVIAIILDQTRERRVAFLDVPRSFIREKLTNPLVGKVEDEDLPLDPLGEAALLLSNSGATTDRQLLLQLVQQAPQSPGAWLAIAHAGNLDAPRALLASDVYQDEHGYILARVAAASALEPHDPKAASFALSQIEAFFTRYEHHDIAYSIGAAMQSKDGRGPEADDFIYWMKHFSMLKSLMVLKGNSVAPLVMRQLRSVSPPVRNVCAAVAALRWPDQLLQAGQGLFDDREYAALLAAIAIRYPERAGLVQGRTTPSRFSEATHQLDTLGAAAFGGAILQGFWE
jgi:hypothetical protein